MSRTISFILVILMSTVLIRSGFAFDNGDLQFWNETSVSWKVNDDWKATIEEEVKWGDDISDFYYEHTDISLYYSGLGRWMDVGFAYRYIFEKSGGKFRIENRPHLNVNFKTKWKDFSISNRHRLEARIREFKEDKPRYRNKSTIKFPVKFSKWELQPYLADEIFIDFDSTELSKNRVYAGLGGKISDNLKIELYYILESGKTSDSGPWKDTNILGAKIKLAY